MSKAKLQLSKHKEQENFEQQDEDYEKTIQYYNKIIEIDQKNPGLYCSRSQVYSKSKNLKMALRDAEECIRIDNKFMKGYVRLIQAHLELDQKDEALEIVNKSIIIFQKNAQQFKIWKMKIVREIQVTPKSPKWEALKKWLYEGGSYFDKLTVAEFSQNYRGIMASKNIQKKDKILYVPLDRLITLEMGKQLPISKKILSKNVQLLSPKHTFLALYLMYQVAKDNSIWLPYIDLLPKKFPSFPMFFNQKDLELFEGSPFLMMIHQKVFDLKRDYESLCNQDPEFRSFTFQHFCWARTAVCSRIFGVTINGVKTDALVPFADMINHRIPKQSSWVFVQKQNGFVMEAIEDIERGQQVFDSYGKKCNSRFLLNYGFVLQNNDMNQVIFKVLLYPKDPLLAIKTNMTGEKSIARIYKVAASPPNDAILYQLLGFLRFRFLGQESILNALRGASNLDQPYMPNRTPPINRKLQIACWDYIKQYCESAIKRYPTTQQEDEQRLKATNLSQNTRNALILLKGQKKLYKHFSTMSSSMKHLLSITRQQFKKQFVKPEYIPFRDYIQKVLIHLIIKE